MGWCWRGRLASGGEAARRTRQAADDALAHEITVVYVASRDTYGVPRIHAELRRLGRRVNRKCVACVMRERDIRGVTRRRRRSLARRDAKAKRAPDLFGRDFHAERPGPSWWATTLTCPSPMAGSTSPAGWTWPPRGRRLRHGRPWWLRTRDIGTRLSCSLSEDASSILSSGSAPHQAFVSGCVLNARRGLCR